MEQLESFVPLPPTPIVYSIDSGQWTNQFVARASNTEEEPQQGDGNQKNESNSKSGMNIGIAAGVVVAVMVLIAVASIYWKKSIRRALEKEQEGRLEGGNRKGRGKYLVGKSVPLAPGDQKIEDIVMEDGYLASQPIESNSSTH